MHIISLLSLRSGMQTMNFENFPSLISFWPLKIIAEFASVSTRNKCAGLKFKKYARNARVVKASR